MFEEYKRFINPDLFFRPFGDHGVGHTKRVLYLSMQLADKYHLSYKNKRLLTLACCYHDIGRDNDWTDDEHGKKSADKFLKLNLNNKHHISGDELELVLDLIVFHSLDDDLWSRDGDARLMYQILKDADALDRLRFNDLDTKYLRLPESKDMIDLEFSLLKADGVIRY